MSFRQLSSCPGSVPPPGPRPWMACSASAPPPTCPLRLRMPVHRLPPYPRSFRSRCSSCCCICRCIFRWLCCPLCPLCLLRRLRLLRRRIFLRSRRFRRQFLFFDIPHHRLYRHRRHPLRLFRLRVRRLRFCHIPGSLHLRKRLFHIHHLFMIQICGHTKHTHNRPQQNCGCIRGSFLLFLPTGILLYSPAVKTTVHPCTFLIFRHFRHVRRHFPLPGAYWHCRFWLLFPFHIHFPVKFLFLFFPEVVLLWHLPVLVINVKSISSVQVPFRLP